MNGSLCMVHFNHLVLVNLAIRSQQTVEGVSINDKLFSPSAAVLVCICMNV